TQIKVEEVKVPEVNVPNLPFIVTEEVEDSATLSSKPKEVEPKKAAPVEPEKEKPKVTAAIPQRQTQYTKSPSFASAPAPKAVHSEATIVKKKENVFWAKLEKQFIENWTGI